jgi:hypothetical protein
MGASYAILQHSPSRVGRLGVSLEAMPLLLQVVVPAMTWWLQSLRLDVAAVQQ